MAVKNTKKSITQKPVEEKVDVNSANLAEENALLKEELNKMMSNYKDMQLQLQNMLLAQQNQNVANNKQVDEPIIVGCRIFNGVTLSSPGNDISFQIPYLDEVEITYSELREIFKSPFGYKNMFKKGILYFANENDYTKFNIKPEIDLSDEAVIDLLSNNSYIDIIEKAKEITKDKRDLMEMFTLIYQIARLIDEKKVNLDYSVRSNLEKYFDVGFDELVVNLHQ